MVWGLSSSGRAPALQAGGGGFESRRLHHNQTADHAPTTELNRGRALRLTLPNDHRNYGHFDFAQWPYKWGVWCKIDRGVDMKLRSIKIENFRSIEEQTLEIKEVVGSHTFALIGVNESGKSNFLEAIALVGNVNAKLSLKDYMDRSKEVRIILNFELEGNDLEEVQQIISGFVIEEEYETDIRATHIDVNAIFDPIGKGRNNTPKTFRVQAVIQKSLGDEQLDENLAIALEEVLSEHFKQEQFRATLWKPEKEYIISESIDLNEFIASPTKFIPLLNCFKMAKLNPKDMLGLTDAEESDIERKLEDVVTNYIKEAWPSHPVRIKFRISDRRLTFLVEDEGFNSGSKTMEQRSDGFRWFVSFLLTIAPDHSGDLQNRPLLLLDEPDLHLHPQAQTDLLRELIRITQGSNRETVLFFATHSSHMIDKEHIDRCYKFSKQSGVTEIENANKGVLQSYAKIKSYAEVNYDVFDIADHGYHNELYGYLESTDEGKAKLGKLQKNRTWYNTKLGRPEPVSLSKYIRHSIHHPENEKNDPYTEEELRESIKTMRKLVQEVQAEMAKAGENGS